MSRILPKSEGMKRVAFSLYPSDIQEIREEATPWGTVGRALEVAIEVIWDRFQRNPKDVIPLGYLGLGVPEEVVAAGKPLPELKVPFACRLSARIVLIMDELLKISPYNNRYRIFKAASLWLNSAKYEYKKLRKKSRG
jgi:hypothetical protein